MKKSHYLLVLAVFVVTGAGVFFFIFSDGKQELRLAPKPRAVSEVAEASGAECGPGWSVKEDPGEAVQEALAMALKDKSHIIPTLP